MDVMTMQQGFASGTRLYSIMTTTDQAYRIRCASDVVPQQYGMLSLTWGRIDYAKVLEVPLFKGI